ncbi:MAG TPA: methylated-DNA--[protein]-cysteine S-methyltransferase [Candidatus Limnocylindria bacterium]|nr:methylated-DNA--[protein]-cysteine S-methyltransferase [Candidatus Limnocylindria bacterium]
MNPTIPRNDEPDIDDRDATVVAALRGLRATAPSSVGFGALVEAGLADRYAPLETPLGTTYVAWNGRGVSWVGTADSPEAFAERFTAHVGRPIERGPELPARLARAIQKRLGGDRRNHIPLDLRGHTPFEVMVWMKALEIPLGEVRPYGWIAAEIGRPKAVRAVGTALAHNPVPLVVPCHRVVRSDGAIGQYSMGGPDAKRRILAAEGLDPARLEADAAAGRRFTGSDTTHIVCHPTCRDAKRVTDRHRVHFPSLAAAANAGYRPCKHCRPVSVAA